MGVAYSLPISRVKLSVFVREYFKDDESRPTTTTIKNHIKAGLLSGKKIGGAWYVECTVWGEPLYYRDKKPANAVTPVPQPIATGNAKADAILKKWINTHGSTTTAERTT